MFNLPKDIETEIKMFCELNQIEDVEGLILNCIKGGFSIEKFGRTPVKAGIEIIEKEKEVIKEVEKEVILEVIKEVPVEVQVEKIVEKIITKTEYITDDTEVKNLLGEIEELKNKLQLKPKEINKEVIVEDTKKVEGLQIEIKKLRNKIDEYEDILRHFQRFSGNKTTHLKSSNLNDELYTD
jgi:hypothetical protein|tara:strand:+ start:7410 stop:7955 length:546 start_codon:yes stop_codon:yes gene_type:complete